MNARRLRAAAVCLLGSLFLVGLVSQPASAETTHKFIKQLELPVGGATPLGVDPQGNIIVRAGNAIYKYNPNGEPVDFSALGSNKIDGLGGMNCPATPADCDRIPWETFEMVTADMNQATTGPTAGYIYVAVVREVSPEVRRSRTFVFDADGNYRGAIDTSQPLPQRSPEGVPGYISISPNGSIVITYSNGENNFDGDRLHADKYQAVDADPAHDVFVGQLRKTGGFVAPPALATGRFDFGVVADDEVVYAGRGYERQPYWELFDAASFTSTDQSTSPVNLDPNGCICSAAGPWKGGGYDDETGGIFESVSIDPADHHAYLLDSSGVIEEWATPSEQVGPAFGTPQTVGGASGPMAFDTSGAGTAGRIYVNRGGGLAVFGPPVPIAGFEGPSATVGHDKAEISGVVNLDHGPKVTDCQVQWAEVNPEQAISYNQSAPCSPAAPYIDETTSVNGLIAGLTTEHDYIARLVVKTGNGINRSRGISIRPAAVLSVKTEPATEVGRTAATLHGSLDPDGIETSYWYEFGSNTEYRQKTVPSTVTGSGSLAVDPAVLQNLQPGRRYHFRLVASNSLGESRGQDATFSTASPPAISGVELSDVTETSATLHARIDTGGYATMYQFEYGPTTSYGAFAPAKETSLGAADQPVPVDPSIANLEPGVTYHFRVTATNEWGTSTTDDSTIDYFPPSCPNSYVRQVTRSAYLPDCRAYELVSPGNAGAVQLFTGNMLRDYAFYQNNDALGYSHLRNEAPNLGTASDPARFGFLGAVGAVNGTNPTNTLLDMYTATRTQTGWVTRYWGLRGDQSDFVGGQSCDISMDECIDYDNAPLNGMPRPPNSYTSNAPYVWDAEGHSLGRWPTNLSLVKEGDKYVGDDRPSPDFSHYVFSSRNIAFSPDGLTTAPGSVYDNKIDDASLTIASKLPSGDPIPPGSADEYIRIPAVSTDGSHILMTTPAPGGVNLYMRVDDSVTYEIAGGVTAIKLIGMTSDGSEVAFTTRSHATADDTDKPFSPDIFVWKESTGEVTRISQGDGAGNAEDCNAPPPTFECSAAPIGTYPVSNEGRPETDDLMASDSGDVYFYSPEQLDPDNPGVRNENNLYVYRHGTVRYVATLDAGTTINRMQISPDGSHAAFVTAARLTSYDNDGWKEMYTYDPETGAIRCVSCDPSGAPPSIVRPPEEPGSSGPRGLPSADVMASQNGPFMSDDGRTAFATSEPLVPSDTNGLVDVYEFVDGRPQLISSGTGKADKVAASLAYPAEYTGLEGISRDGVDIYFTTFDTLAPDEDFNGEFVKFYDARTGGGFTPPPTQLPCVAADECHGTENPGPPKTVIGTGSELGQPAHGQPSAKAKKRRKARHKRAQASHGKHRRAARGGHHG